MEIVSMLQRIASEKSRTAEETRLIGYARVSTLEQRLDMQLDALKAAGIHGDDIYVEKTSAASKRREQLELAIMALRPGDTLVVWRLDRIARNIRDLYRRIDSIYEKGADFRSLTESFDFTTSTGKLILGFLGLMADFERQLTIDRTKAGMQALRDRGVALGAPRKIDDEKVKEIGRMMNKEQREVVDVAKSLRVAKSSIYKYFTVTRRKGRIVAKLKAA